MLILLLGIAALNPTYTPHPSIPLKKQLFNIHKINKLQYTR